MEELKLGKSVQMPCSHVYHCHCVLQWGSKETVLVPFVAIKYPLSLLLDESKGRGNQL